MDHLFSMDQLSKKEIFDLIQQAYFFLENPYHPNILLGKTIVHLFFEESTRTNLSFSIAASDLGAQVHHLLIKNSSQKKGESFQDTVNNVLAMGPDALVIRHSQSGIIKKILDQDTKVKIINAGDGQHAHPSQSLLNMMVIHHHKKNFENIKVAILGDIRHSRVARSDIIALKTLGCKDIRLIGPNSLLPLIDLGPTIKYFNRLEHGLKDIDVIMCLRLQKERMSSGLISSTSDYHLAFGLKKNHLSIANPLAIIMHPGPVNVDVEISKELLSHDRCMVLQQVTFGLAMRKAIFNQLLANI